VHTRSKIGGGSVERDALEIAAQVVEAELNGTEGTAIAAAIASTRQRSEQTPAPQVDALRTRIEVYQYL
jgi:hypothetical protein